MKCRACGKPIIEGYDAISIEEGVIGQHGFVPINTPSVCCCSDCVKGLFSPDHGYYKRPRRVP